jgi:hypothetical protein
MAKLARHGDTIITKGNNAQQRDLFTGEWEARHPKRGNGFRVRLKPVDGEKAVVPGMASYAGEGPAGCYCKSCACFGSVAVQTGVDDVEINRTGCAIYAQRMGHAAPTTRRDIRLCAACKHFVPGDESKRHFIIDRAGVVHRAEKLPPDLAKWRATDSAALDEPVTA